jgi:hypothetical protein
VGLNNVNEDEANAGLECIRFCFPTAKARQLVFSGTENVFNYTHAATRVLNVKPRLKIELLLTFLHWRK